MSGPKHTPGPWRVSGTDDHGQAIVRGDHIEIATCWHHSVGAIEQEMHANAKLIAAAPRLAEALKEIAKGAPTIMPTSLVEREHWRLAKIARAALREAGVTDDA